MDLKNKYFTMYKKRKNLFKLDLFDDPGSYDTDDQILKGQLIYSGWGKLEKEDANSWFAYKCYYF